MIQCFYSARQILLKKQHFYKLCTFALFLSTSYQVAMSKSPIFFANEIQVHFIVNVLSDAILIWLLSIIKNGQVLVVINICNYLIFLAVFSGSHINDLSQQPSKVVFVIHLVVC